MFEVGDIVRFNNKGAALYYLSYNESPPKKAEIILIGRNLDGRNIYSLKCGLVSIGWWGEVYLEKVSIVTLISVKRVKK